MLYLFSFQYIPSFCKEKFSFNLTKIKTCMMNERMSFLVSETKLLRGANSVWNSKT